jgi:hypothetical protein
MKVINVTKIVPSTQKGVTKCVYQWERIDERNIRHTGNGRFACLEGNEQNWPGLIAQDLKRKHGSVDVKMPPPRNTLGLKKAG